MDLGIGGAVVLRLDLRAVEPDASDSNSLSAGNVAGEAVTHHGCFSCHHTDLLQGYLEDLGVGFPNTYLPGYHNRLKERPQPGLLDLLMLDVGNTVGDEGQSVIRAEILERKHGQEGEEEIERRWEEEAAEESDPRPEEKAPIDEDRGGLLDERA